MGQVLPKGPANYIPYDANAWRRLSREYLNSLNDNGELIPDKSQADPSRASSRAPSRQSSVSSRHDGHDSRHTYRLPAGAFPHEPNVLQEYQPKNKQMLSQHNLPNSDSSNGQEVSQHDLPQNSPRMNQQQQRASRQQSGASGNVNSPNSQSPSGEGESDGRKGKGSSQKMAHLAPPGTAGRDARLEESRIQQAHSTGAQQRSDERDGHDHSWQQNGLPREQRIPGFKRVHQDDFGNEHQPGRAQSPKSSTTWNTSSDDYPSSTYSNTHQPGRQQLSSQHHLSPGGLQRSSTRSDHSTVHFDKHLTAGAAAGALGSRQSSGRSGRSGVAQYIPYRDYFLDRHLRGQTGPPSYSDMSGYIKPSQRRVARKGINCSKWLFIICALLAIACTIWSSVYMQLMSKRMELGFPIQGKLYSMSDGQRHFWEGTIVAGQVVSNIASIVAIYAALVERYWLLWTYTPLMFLFGVFGAVSELTRGSVSSWLLPILCAQMAAILTHQIGIQQQYRRQVQ